MILYEMRSEYSQALREMEEAGFDSETIENTLGGLQVELADKIKNVAFYIRNTESEIVAIDSEIKRLSGMKKSRSNSADRLKEYLLENMVATGVTVDDPIMPVKLAKCPPSLGAIDESKVPEIFWVQPETPPRRIDRNGLLAFVKNEPIEGIELVTDKMRLKIG